MWVFKRGASAEISTPRARAAARRGQDKRVLRMPDFPAWSQSHFTLASVVVQGNYVLGEISSSPVSVIPREGAD